QALSIYYFPLDKKIVLIGKALLTQNKDSVQGDKITYYLETGILNAEASKNNRTTVIIAPESLKNS
ncbi:MAG: OstA-like protein, partial [Francisellaceae bacterium]|nr:OstA-like protein [Francisellaceae bacterium]